MSEQLISEILHQQQGTLNNPVVQNEIFEKSKAKSVFGLLGKPAQFLIGTETVFPIAEEYPVAQILGEAEPKNASDISFTSRTGITRKAQVTVEFSIEAVKLNPLNVLGRLKETLSDAIAETINHGLFYGQLAYDSALISRIESDYINSTTQRVPVSGFIDDAITDAIDIVMDNGYNANGFAFDPKISSLMRKERDTTGRQLNANVLPWSGLGSYDGMPAVTSRYVSGWTRKKPPNPHVLGFVGDWDALQWGVAEEFNLEVIPYGDPSGRGDLKRKNKIAYRTEIFFGWVIMDPTAFVAIELPTASPAAGSGGSNGSASGGSGTKSGSGGS